MESSPEMQDLCFYCFDVLISYLNKSKEQIPFPESFKGQKHPLFVTWQTGKDLELRGCIGTFGKDDLEKQLKKYAIISAVQDDRFEPITKKDLKDLTVNVSILTDFEEVEDPLDWEVGKHGVEIYFTHRNREYSATFLPEVAKEEGWDQKTTLKYLIQKSGYSGKVDTILNNIKAKRYQSKKSSLSYEEYKKCNV
jgi:uncharacterized protein (TIGR00296 family)